MAKSNWLSSEVRLSPFRALALRFDARSLRDRSLDLSAQPGTVAQSTRSRGSREREAARRLRRPSKSPQIARETSPRVSSVRLDLQLSQRAFGTPSSSNWVASKCQLDFDDRSRRVTESQRSARAERDNEEAHRYRDQGARNNAWPLRAGRDCRLYCTKSLWEE